MLSELRTQLIADLVAADVNVHEGTWNDRFAAPAVMVHVPNSGTYVTTGQFRGEYAVALDLYLAVPSGDNFQSALDSLIESVLINSSDWAFKNCDAVGIVNIHGVDYPGTVVHIAKQGKLF